ncbi:hypothetical protein ACIRBX_34395 [Kitasatospora sp. NPDC096147]|uniref:hypothetical protein n=1 Tax=Kitasatospora sp. NPDC096147 TaxID=3364093 RepID=UPI00380D1D65
MRIAPEIQIKAELERVSEQVYQALGVTGSREQGNEVNFSQCEGQKDAKVRSAIHFWQVDGLDPEGLNQAVERVRDHLKASGWIGAGEQWDATHTDLEVWAKNPEKTVAVWSQALRDRKRVIFRVSSSCFRLPDA